MGKPLIAHSIDVAKEVGLFSHIVVSSDCSEILAIARQFGAEVFFERPADLAHDTAAKIPVIRHAFEASEAYYGEVFDVVVDLDCTSPLRLASDIRQCVDMLIDENRSNVITAMKARRSPYFNLIERNSAGHWAPSKQLQSVVYRRQDSPDCYDMNASIYVWDRNTILTQDRLFLEDTGLYVMPEERSFDIDTPTEFKIVEALMRLRQE
jgi:CMP-N,N'-diacetyllegionaminic acid synthase